MTEPRVPRIPKWPFVVGDMLLLGLGIWLASTTPAPFPAWTLLALFGCAALGAWICVKPFLADHDAELKFAESHELKDATEQLKNLQHLAERISLATSQWQTLQEASAKTTTAAHDIGERMTAEAKSFAEFMRQANDTEKNHLRLEAEKLRRSQSEWLETAVRLMDHVYAVTQAAAQSGQPNLMAQLSQFQNSCRDVVRRLGLVPHEAKAGEPYDEKKHQVPDPEAKIPSGARIGETLATGYSFQGQLIRPVVVSLKGAELPAEPDPQTEFPLGSAS